MKAIALVILILAVVFSTTTNAGDLNARCTSGITYLKDGLYSAEGNLVQLMWAGPDGKIDDPSAETQELGAPTGDDQFIRDTYIGNGYLLGYGDGRFDKLFSHSSIEAGRMLYLRAWDTDVITNVDDSYGDSNLYQVQSADEFEDNDFRK